MTNNTTNKYSFSSRKTVTEVVPDRVSQNPNQWIDRSSVPSQLFLIGSTAVD